MRRCWRILARTSRYFNPRTPYGVRPLIVCYNNIRIKFQSTHSIRSATLISFWKTRTLRDFNPRTPYGVRQSFSSFRPSFTPFQSTHSIRSATSVFTFWSPSSVFQSTHSIRSATATIALIDNIGGTICKIKSILLPNKV